MSDEQVVHSYRYRQCSQHIVLNGLSVSSGLAAPEGISNLLLCTETRHNALHSIH